MVSPQDFSRSWRGPWDENMNRSGRSLPWGIGINAVRRLQNCPEVEPKTLLLTALQRACLASPLSCRVKKINFYPNSFGWKKWGFKFDLQRQTVTLNGLFSEGTTCPPVSLSPWPRGPGPTSANQPLLPFQNGFMQFAIKIQIAGAKKNEPRRLGLNSN